MKKLSVFTLVAILVFLGTAAFAAELAESGALGVVDSGAVVRPGSMVLVADQNADEVQIPTPTDLDRSEYMDEHVLALSDTAQAIIKALAAEIEQLGDRSDEVEVQRKIEKIKLEEEITRLHIQLEMVKDRDNQKLVAEIEKEIAHLGTIDQPVIGMPGEQPVIGAEEVVK